MQNFVVMGTMIVTDANKDVLNIVRETIESQQLDDNKIRISSTLINDVLICRALANQAEVARESFISIWKSLRPYIMQRQAVAPRIWFT